MFCAPWPSDRMQSTMMTSKFSMRPRLMTAGETMVAILMLMYAGVGMAKSVLMIRNVTSPRDMQPSLLEQMLPLKLEIFFRNIRFDSKPVPFRVMQPHRRDQ